VIVYVSQLTARFFGIVWYVIHSSSIIKYVFVDFRIDSSFEVATEVIGLPSNFQIWTFPLGRISLVSNNKFIPAADQVTFILGGTKLSKVNQHFQVLNFSSSDFCSCLVIEYFVGDRRGPRRKPLLNHYSTLSPSRLLMAIVIG
jgi:hypothetical protein